MKCKSGAINIHYFIFIFIQSRINSQHRIFYVKSKAFKTNLVKDSKQKKDKKQVGLTLG